MPEISAFCPKCGRAVSSSGEDQPAIADVKPVSRAALLAGMAYLTFLPAVVLLFVPALKKASFVRFHCWQSVMFFVATAVAAVAMRLSFAILSLIPGLGFLLACLFTGLLSLALVFLWIAAVLKAALGEAYELPVIGNWAAAMANR